MLHKKLAGSVSNPAPSVPSESSESSPDVALIQGVTSDGKGLHIVRAREDRLEVGVIHPLREGVPITGEVVTLRPRPNFPALCDVETHYKPVAAPTTDQPASHSALMHPGPAQVASNDYRRNWDAIWPQLDEKPKLVN